VQYSDGAEVGTDNGGSGSPTLAVRVGASPDANADATCSTSDPCVIDMDAFPRGAAPNVAHLQAEFGGFQVECLGQLGGGYEIAAVGLGPVTGFRWGS